MFRFLSTAVLLLLVALPGVALAQGTGTLAGRVVDATTGETLPGANVRIEATTLGAAANMSGEYRIIGVPVGTYNVTASFAGYQPQTITDVSISSGYTRELNFSLSSATLGTVEVTEYRQPLIQQDAIGAVRVVSGEELQNLPVRGVNEVAAIQASTVSPEGSGNLFVRGGREQEVQYFVDGVRVVGGGLIGVNQNAVEEQEMIIGTIPARYGDVQSGVINITTRTGRDRFFGNVELLTSQGLDAFGYNLAALSLGGPIVRGRAGFFLSGQIEDQADASPSYVESYRLSSSAYNELLAAPQVLRTITPATGETGYVSFPADVDRTGLTGAELEQLLRSRGLLAEGTNLSSFALLPAAETFTADNFELARGKRDPLRNLTFNGNVNLTPGASTQVRLGGGLATRNEEIYRFGGSLFNPEAFNNRERSSWRGFATLRQRFGNTAFAQLQGEYSDARTVLYPNGFSSDIRDALFYGDVDFVDRDGNPLPGAASHVGASSNYYVFNSTTSSYQRLYRADGATLPGTIGGLFDAPGRRLTTYQRSRNEQLRFTGSLTAQLGVHQLEVGTEFQRETRRFISLGGLTLARYFADGSVENAAELPLELRDGVERYEQLPFQAVRPAIGQRYGYDYLGLNEVNDQDIDGFYTFDAQGNRANTNIAPYQPIYYAGYIQDKIEYRDVVLQLGLRVDVFDNNALVLEDIFATRPIVRVRNADQLPAGFQRPSSVEDNYAVYFNDAGAVVGYRDLEGNFFDREGLRTTAQRVQEDLQGAARDLPGARRSDAFRNYEPGVLFMPRIGVSFPITDRGLFFASYNVTGQRPTEFAFAPFTNYDELTGQDQRVPNTTLRPERTTQYELGYRQRLGDNAAMTLSGFVRNQTNKIANRRVTGGLAAYGTYLNTDFTTSKGMELAFDLRRTRNLALNANYTLSFASGTGSDANATATIVWRGNFFPNTLSPADFDQRHTANVSVDYRFGAGEGPMVGNVRPLENFGINLLGQFGSGLRYTPLVASANAVFESFTADADGTINSGTLPATSRLDLRVDRAFQVARGTQMRAYMTVTNLLDTRNVLAVYRATGLPNQDGFLASPTGQNYLDNAPDRPGREFLYSTYIGGMNNVGGSHTSSNGTFYGGPRRVRFGLLFDF